MGLPLLHLHDDDATLVARVRAGDMLAFDAIVARHRPRLLAHARRVLGDRRDAAEDVVQEALVRAHRALLRDDRLILLSPWLHKLTRNCALDELSRVHADSVPLEAPAAEAALVAPHGEPADVHELRQNVRGMLEGIATLPAEQRHALLRREVDGASHREVARELGISAQASKALVFRARANLTKHDEARDDRCAAVQDEIVRAHRAGRRASAHVHRHLLGCAGCRAYRGQLRALRRALHVLHPGPVLLLAAAGVKAGAVAKGAGGAVAGGAAAAPKAGAGLLAALAATAVGGTLVVTAGEPSPVALRSELVPGGRVEAGAPLPPGTALVARVARGDGTVTLRCPGGHRVGDLLPPEGARVAAGYVAGTIPGATATAKVAIAGARGERVGVAVLCRRPGPDGSMAREDGARASAAGARPAAVCRTHAYLRVRPRGATAGSVRLAQPVRVLGRAPGWREVRTDLGARGWLPAGAVCARPAARAG